MKLFITASFKGDEKQLDIEQLRNLVKQAGFEDFCFAIDIKNIFHNPRKLMERAKREIEMCDALLIDMTDKSMGRTIEAGMAFAMNKKIVILVRRGTVLKDTARGIADMVIEYEQIDDILPELKKFLSDMKKFKLINDLRIS